MMTHAALSVLICLEYFSVKIRTDAGVLRRCSIYRASDYAPTVAGARLHVNGGKYLPVQERYREARCDRSLPEHGHALQQHAHETGLPVDPGLRKDRPQVSTCGVGAHVERPGGVQQ